MRRSVPLRVATLIAAVAMIATTSLAFASSPHTVPRQNNPQLLNIGVIGPFDGPTAQGVTLAVQRLSNIGPTITPDGTAYTPAVIAIDASTPEQVTSTVDK